MSTPRLLHLLHRVGGEFWLPLPLIAVLVWFTGDWMAARVLNGSYDSVNKLQTGTQLTTKRSVTILTMNAEIVGVGEASRREASPLENRHPGIEPDFYQYQVSLAQGELTRLQTELADLQNDYPDLQTIIAEQLRDELLEIEAETYAELVQAGRLDRELSLLMEVAKREE